MDIITLYVIAGPNGIGKTTSVYNLIPSGIPVINSDEIARQAMLAGIAKVNTQEYSNLEAMRLVNEHIESRFSFAIETNLADEETWKFLKKAKETGYKVHLLFMCTDKIELLNTRINERQNVANTLFGQMLLSNDI